MEVGLPISVSTASLQLNLFVLGQRYMSQRVCLHQYPRQYLPDMSQGLWLVQVI